MCGAPSTHGSASWSVWATLLDYFFLPMVIWLIGATFLQQGFPGVPFWAWIVGFILLTMVLNILGIKVAEQGQLHPDGLQLLVVAAVRCALAAGT